MEPVPLIPKINSVSCPDTSHILREEFQEYLEDEKFPRKIADNIHEFNVKNSQLKACGTEIVNSYNQMKINVLELSQAEEMIMISQAEFLNHKAIEENKFKLERIFPTIDENVIQKYSLIKVEDIMPHITERILNIKMEPHEFKFKDACPEIRQSLSSLEKFQCSACEENELKKSYLKVSDSKQSQLAKIARHNKQIQESKIKIKHDFSQRKVFEVQPNEIEFINFEKNVVYETYLRIRNITTVTQTFLKPTLPPHSKFAVRQSGNQCKLAPGMSAIFVVSFVTSDMSDKFEDCLVLHISGSEDICVRLYSYRDTPVVNGIVCLEDENIRHDVEKKKNDVFNYTIDCGALLHGCSKEFRFIVQNCGGPGTFFVLSEEDWVSGEISNITEDFKLVLQDFILYPAYFELKESEVKEIKIIFNPTQYGLCLDKIFLLCDSNNAEELDIIGDCIFYEPYYIKFEMPDCPLPPLKKIQEPNNILHLGAIYSKQSITGFFKVHNTSTVSFAYEWHKNKYTKNQGFIPINSDNIQIYPDKGVFLPASYIEFEVTVFMSSNEFGLYKFAYSLYILDILEENLGEGPIYTFGEEYRNEIFEKCLTLLVNNVEVQIHHIPIQLYIYPENITFPKLIYQTESYKKKVKIVNEGFCCISCEWIHDTGCGCSENSQDQINIDPCKFELEAGNFIDCMITIIPSSYEDIHEKFELSINKSFAVKHFSIVGQVEKPHIRISHTFFDFGAMVKRGSFASAELSVENETDAQLYWRVQEYKYNVEMEYFVEVYPKSLAVDCGCLCHKGSGTRLEYVLDTSRPRRFLSLLVFYTIYNSKAYESSHVILVANILQPIVSIVNANYKENVFNMEEEFFVQETITRSFFVHNDSPLEVYYRWKQPTGLHAPLVSISLPSWDGKLYPWSRRHIEITIKFLQAAYLRDLYVPCIIEALLEPIYLNICCTVKPPQILISIPLSSRNFGYEDILWPSYEILRYSDISTTGEDDNKIDDFIAIPEKDHCESDLQIVNVLPENDYLQWWYPDIITYLENLDPDMCGEGFVDFLHSSETNITPAVSSSETQSQISMRTFLASGLTSSTNFCSYHIEFRNVTCRQLYKKTFELRNIMDIPIKFKITVKNFKIKSLHRKRLDTLLINMNWRYDDKYSQQLSEHGILVIINPELGDLRNKTTLTIEIQVYAETFGFYVEEIAIEVENLPVFYLNLFIQVIGSPVEFPASDNSLDVSDIFLRYGNFSVCSKPEKRSIFLRNNCTIPFKIIWHIFVKNTEDYLKGPINIAYDIFGFGHQTDCELKFLNYIGKECYTEYDLLEISPREFYIKPQELKSVEVTLNPEYFQDINNNLSSNVDAVLVGHIYLDKQHQIVKDETNFVFRHPEKQLSPIKLNLSANIESAHLDLSYIAGNRTMVVSVSDYLILEKDVAVNMRFVFRNSSNFNLIIGVNIDEPFRIISIKSASSESSACDANDMFTCLVSPNNCAEIWVQCKMDTNSLLKIADVLYRNIAHYLEDTAVSKDNRVKITKPLYIYHECDIKQEIPLSVIFIFPLTFVSVDSLDFGQVTVGTEKLLTFKLQNKTVSKTWFRISHENCKVFTVYPYKGYLEPMKPATYFVYITVKFKPNDVGDFEDNLKIITCLTHYEQEVKIIGRGTFDEKHVRKLKLQM